MKLGEPDTLVGVGTALRGFTTDIGDNTTLTADYYLVKVDDRIYQTGDIVGPNGTTVSFYTNALDMEHQGIDLVLTSNIGWSGDASTSVSFAFSYNKVDVTGQKVVDTINGPVTPVGDGLVEDIENNFPNDNRLSVGLPYPRRTPANYEGGSWYAKVSYNF